MLTSLLFIIFALLQIAPKDAVPTGAAPQNAAPAGAVSTGVAPAATAAITSPVASAPRRPEGAPAAGASKRLVGDAEIVPVLQGGGEYRLPAMEMLIEAPLPDGYPAPTPPGMIELKTYPSVRRAEYSAKGNSNFGMNVGFWPLFNHIKSREIAMTSPVEMDYHPAGERAPLAPMKDAEGTWTMSFLYRTATLGPTGEDGRVRVVDVPEVTVIAIGMRGAYGMGTVNAGLEALQAWFQSQQEWEPAGDPRGLNYNGPQIPWRNKWSEVQVPVKRKMATADTSASEKTIERPANIAPSSTPPAQTP